MIFEPYIIAYLARKVGTSFEYQSYICIKIAVFIIPCQPNSYKHVIDRKYWSITADCVAPKMKNRVCKSLFFLLTAGLCVSAAAEEVPQLSAEAREILLQQYEDWHALEPGDWTEIERSFTPEQRVEALQRTQEIRDVKPDELVEQTLQFL